METQRVQDKKWRMGRDRVDLLIAGRAVTINNRNTVSRDGVASAGGQNESPGGSPNTSYQTHHRGLKSTGPERFFVVTPQVSLPSCNRVRITAA